MGDRDAYLARMADLKRQWHAGDRLVRPADEPKPDPAISYADLIGDQLWGTSSFDSPMRMDLFKSTIRDIAGGGKDGSVGLTARMKPIRESFASKLIVRDLQAIPTEYKTNRDDRCIRLHPGFCRRAATPSMLRCHGYVCALLQPWPRGCLLRFRGNDKNGREFSFYRLLSDNRREDSITFAKVYVVGTDSELQIAHHQYRGFDFQTSQAALADVWRHGDPEARENKC